MWMASLAIPISALGPVYPLNFGGRFLPEPFLILWVTAFSLSSPDRMSCTKEFLRSKLLWLSLSIMLFIGAIGLARHDASISELYSSSRSATSTLIGFLLCDYHQRKRTLVQFLDKICLLIVIATFYTLATGYMIGAVKLPINGAGLLLSLFYLLDRRKTKLAMTAFVVLTIAAILSFIRQNYGFIAIGTIYISSLTIASVFSNSIRLHVKKSDLTVLTALTLVTVTIVSQSDRLYNWIAADPSRYAQSIHKYNNMVSMLNGGAGNSSDGDRAAGLSFFFENFEYFQLPNGFVNQISFETWSIWGGGQHVTVGSLVMDSGFAYIVGQFGFIVFYFILALFSFRSIRFYLIKGHIREKFRTFLLQIAICIPFLLDGGYYTQSERSFVLGIVIAMAFPRRSALNYGTGSINNASAPHHSSRPRPANIVAVAPLPLTGPPTSAGPAQAQHRH